jgi:hypothetical protein
MPTALLIILGLIALGLFGWIVYRLNKNKAFATADAIALLGLVVTLLVAVLPFALERGDATKTGPQVTVEGPDAAKVGERAYFTIVSQGASRAEWSIGGFADGEIFKVDPLPPSHSIYIEPTNAGRAGESFTLAVTVYAEDGASALATKKFVVVSP